MRQQLCNDEKRTGNSTVLSRSHLSLPESKTHLHTHTHTHTHPFLLADWNPLGKGDGFQAAPKPPPWD